MQVGGGGKVTALSRVSLNKIRKLVIAFLKIKALNPAAEAAQRTLAVDGVARTLGDLEVFSPPISCFMLHSLLSAVTWTGI